MKITLELEILEQYFIPILPTPALRVNNSGGKGTGNWVLKYDDEWLKAYDLKRKIEQGKQGYTFRKKKSIEKYYGYKDEVAFWFKNNNITPPVKDFSVEFRLPIGDSIRPKIAEKRLIEDHELRPDFDNLAKAFVDAFLRGKKLLWFDYDDAVTNRVLISKSWCKSGDEGINVIQYRDLSLKMLNNLPICENLN